ncbi:hypothetical protein Tco_0052748 [Tanacetum coccineum]
MMQSIIVTTKRDVSARDACKSLKQEEVPPQPVNQARVQTSIYAIRQEISNAIGAKVDLTTGEATLRGIMDFLGSENVNRSDLGWGGVPDRITGTEIISWTPREMFGMSWGLGELGDWGRMERTVVSSKVLMLGFLMNHRLGTNRFIEASMTSNKNTGSSHLMGENLGCLNVEELQLETTLERGISKITSKKLRQLLSGSQAGTSQCIPMFKADDNQLHADAVPEYTHSLERDITIVPVSRIFDRLRNMSMNAVESDYMTHIDVQHPVVSRPLLTTLNISFPNNNDENIHRSYLPAKHPRLHRKSVHNTVSPTSEPSILNVYKRKYLQPLSALSSKEASSSRNIKGGQHELHQKKPSKQMQHIAEDIPIIIRQLAPNLILGQKTISDRGKIREIVP